MSLSAYPDEVYDAIKAHLIANWSATPIAWPNEPFDRPLDAASNPLPFVAVQITGDLYDQESIGESEQAANRWDEEGRIWLHVFAPTNSGHSTVRGAAKALADVFRGRTLLSGKLEFREAFIGEGEPGDDAGIYWRVSASVNWRHWDA